MNKSTLFLFNLFFIINFSCNAMEKSNDKVTIQDLNQLLQQYNALIANVNQKPNVNDISKKEQQEEKSKANSSQPSDQLPLSPNIGKVTIQDLSQLLSQYNSLLAKKHT